MAKIICTGCGVEGFSKCPYCRSIFLDHEQPIARLERWASHHLKIDAKQLSWKLFEGTSPFEGLKDLQNLLTGATEDELRVLACVHTWDFAPLHESEIGCGHYSEEGKLKEFMEHVATYLIDKGDEEAFEIVSNAMSSIR